MINQEYIFDLTPARARTIVQLAKHTKNVIDPLLLEKAESKAEEDLIPTEAYSDIYYPTSPAMRKSIQEVVDFDFQAIIPFSDNADANTARIIPIIAARLKGILPITIYCNSHVAHRWGKINWSRFGFDQNKDRPDVSFSRVGWEALENDNVDPRKEGLLIIDLTTPMTGFDFKITMGLSRDFKYTCVVGNPKFSKKFYDQFGRNRLKKGSASALSDQFNNTNIQMLSYHHQQRANPILGSMEHGIQKNCCFVRHGVDVDDISNIYRLFNIVKYPYVNEYV